MEQPRVVESTLQDVPKKSVVTPAVQTRGTRKLEDMSPGAAASPLSGVVSTDNHKVEAMARKVEFMRRLQAEAKVKFKAEVDAELVEREAKAKAKAARAKARAEAHEAMKEEQKLVSNPGRNA